MFEIFPQKQPGDSLSADHVNRLSRVASQQEALVLGGNAHGLDNRTQPFPPFRQGTFYVTDDPDDESSGSGSSQSISSSGSVINPPGVRSDLYEIRPRYYDHTVKQWFIDETKGPWDLDAGGLGLSLSVGDVVTAWYDQQRGAWIPVQGSSSSTASGAGLIILFEICESCCEECWADVTILSKTSTETLPGLGATVTKCGVLEESSESSSQSLSQSSASSISTSSVSSSSSSTPGSSSSSSSSESSSNSTSSSSTGSGVKTLGPHQLRVYDLAGCFFKEANANLIGRRGYAIYMMEDAWCCNGKRVQSMECGGWLIRANEETDVSNLNCCQGSVLSPTCDDPLSFPKNRWEVFSLCCCDDDCGV